MNIINIRQRLSDWIDMKSSTVNITLRCGKCGRVSPRPIYTGYIHYNGQSRWFQRGVKTPIILHKGDSLSIELTRDCPCKPRRGK